MFYEENLNDIKYHLCKLSLEIKYAQEWIDKAKESRDMIQEMIFDMEDEAIEKVLHG